MNTSIKKQGGRCWPAAAMLLILLVAFALPSYAALNGTISGTVKDSNGNLQDVEVYVYDAEDTSGFPPAPEFTDENGWYEVSLPPGTHRYKVQFKKENYIEQWYEGAPMIDCATPLTVAEGAALAGINAILSQGTSSVSKRSFAQSALEAASTTGSSISGNVTLDGKPLKCAQVQAYSTDDEATWKKQVFTNYQGDYTINGLASGSYKILFYDQNDQVGQWYNRKAASACADTVPETASGINAAFPVSLRQCGDRPTILPAIKLLLE